MASPQQVRQYLAHWFQLGRQVLSHKEGTYCPASVIQGDRYSPEFEACWSTLMQSGGADLYLEGTEQTIAELLSSAWEINLCSRCPLLVPVKVQGIQPGACPCSTLSTWPNLELPAPRLPINSQTQLTQICDRIQTPPPAEPLPDCPHYPLPQSLMLQTAIAAQIAMGQQLEQQAGQITEQQPGQVAAPPTTHHLGRICNRLREPLGSS
ncbi:MAG: hypothetical protein AAGG51_08270 [Cyanobacteria bacterium P01_G01_bin.54]